MRRYNTSYMENHDIDWFFCVNNTPYYVQSNGLIIPDIIKVKNNRYIQDILYEDISKDLDYLNIISKGEEIQPDYQLFEYNLYAQSFNNDQDDVPSISNNKGCSYLCLDDYSFDNRGIDLILSNEYLIANPNEAQRTSIKKSYVAMARRGYICLYPLVSYDNSLSYLVIGRYSQYVSNTKLQNTIAYKKMEILPYYDKCRFSFYIENDTLLTCDSSLFSAKNLYNKSYKEVI